jgi:hypothetical protein
MATKKEFDVVRHRRIDPVSIGRCRTTSRDAGFIFPKGLFTRKYQIVSYDRILGRAAKLEQLLILWYDTSLGYFVYTPL